jgi:UrcA family protein
MLHCNWTLGVRCPELQGETSLFVVVTKEITMLFRSLTAAALLALGLTAAHAEDFSLVSTTVPFGDLNLSKPTDAKVLAGRLVGAAKSVCLQANPDIDSPVLMQQCIGSAISMAMTEIEDRLDQDVSDKLVVVRTSLESP